MQAIKRDIYLNRLIERKENGAIKVITGIRRCGKSYLLFNLYYDYLLSCGIGKDRIIKIALDDEEAENLTDAKTLAAFIKEQLKDENTYYVFLDEIQFVKDFEKVLNSLNRLPNLDIYVTGSNSKFLSSDILTEFRGRGDEVRVHPLCFAEYVSAYKGSAADAWNDYFTYGGLPQILTRSTDELKTQYLTNLFQTVYLADIIDRNKVRAKETLNTLVNVLASSIGSLTNPRKLAAVFAHSGNKEVTDKTVGVYLDYLTDSFLINKAERYDIKGKKYIASPYKYYFEDVGLRNARLNFRQQEENHIMENIIYNELLVRGYNVDVGIVDCYDKDEQGKQILKRREVDFVCNKGSRRYYVQSAFAIPDDEKMAQEKMSLVKIKDSFKKIIVVKDSIKLWRTEDGIVVMGLQEFLLNQNSLEL